MQQNQISTAGNREDTKCCALTETRSVKTPVSKQVPARFMYFMYRIHSPCSLQGDKSQCSNDDPPQPEINLKIIEDKKRKKPFNENCILLYKKCFCSMLVMTELQMRLRRTCLHHNIYYLSQYFFNAMECQIIRWSFDGN